MWIPQAGYAFIPDFLDACPEQGCRSGKSERSAVCLDLRRRAPTGSTIRAQ